MIFLCNDQLPVIKSIIHKCFECNYLSDSSPKQEYNFMKFIDYTVP